MKQIYTGKIESATFSNPPENSTIEFLWRDSKQLVANEIAINFADPEFLAFIEEYPLEKIEKAAKAAARAKSKAKDAYNQKIIDEYKKTVLPREISKLQERLLDENSNLMDLYLSKFSILEYVDQNNKDKDLLFDYKLKILDKMLQTTKNKPLQLKIRKAKTLKELLGIYYGI